MELVYVENPKETLAGIGVPIIPYGKCFVEFDEAGLPLKIWSAVEEYKERDADAYLLYDRTQHSAKFDAIAENLATALMNASRIKGKNHTARIFAASPSVYVETHGYDCVFTQRVGGHKIESDGQVETRLDDLKKWLNANKKSAIRIDGLTFKNGENSYTVDDWQSTSTRYVHVENPINTISITDAVFATLNEIAQKYKGGDKEWMQNVFVRLIPSGAYDDTLFIGKMEYVITNGHAIYMGIESVIMDTDKPVSFSLPIDGIYAVHMANKNGKHFNWGEVMIHIDDTHTTIETSNGAIQCTNEIQYVPNWILKKYGTLFDILKSETDKFENVEIVTSTMPPATKYDKNELCHFDGTRIVAGESTTFTNFDRAYVPDNIVWEHNITVYDKQMMIRYEGNVVVIIGLYQR